MNKKSQRLWAKSWVLGLSKDQKYRLDYKISQVVETVVLNLVTQTSNLVLGAYYPMQDEVVWDSGINLPPSIEIVYPEMKPEYQLDYGKVPDVILVPGLLFSEAGERLGRGGGYFDRFLPSFKGITIGVNYEKRIVDVVTDEHDQKVQGLITETGYRLVKK